MSAVDEIISYKRTPDEDFYGLLKCDEHSSVSEINFFRQFWIGALFFFALFHSAFVFIISILLWCSDTSSSEP